MFLAGRGSQIRHTQALLKSVGEGLGEGSHPGLCAHAKAPYREAGLLHWWIN